MGGKCDLNDVNSVMVIVGLHISEIDDLLGFFHAIVCTLYTVWLQRKQTSNEQFHGKKCYDLIGQKRRELVWS